MCILSPTQVVSERAREDARCAPDASSCPTYQDDHDFAKTTLVPQMPTRSQESQQY